MTLEPQVGIEPTTARRTTGAKTPETVGFPQHSTEETDASTPENRGNRASKPQRCRNAEDESSPIIARHGGAKWLAEEFSARERKLLSALGVRVADVLGEVWFGIYHLPRTALFHERTDWSNDHSLVVVVGQELANHDGSELTRLVLLCHAAGLRLAISGRARDYLELRFSYRQEMFCGPVPSVEKVVSRFSARYLPAAQPAAAEVA